MRLQTGLRPTFLKSLIFFAILTVSSFGNQLTISWDDNSPNETGFKIERSSDGVTFSLVRTVDANVTSHVDAGLAAATTYWYRVCAYNSTSSSTYSNPTQCTTPGAILPPALPPTSGTPVSRLTRFSAKVVSAPWGAGALQLDFGISSATKKILLRAIGPGLNAYTDAATLVDPRLDLSSGSLSVATNDNWGGSATLSTTFTQLGAFPLQTTSKDAALLVSVPPKNYTASIRGKQQGSALAELFDADTEDASAGRIAKVFARGNAGTGEAIFVAGFTISGNAPQRVLLRAIGPSLAGIQGVLRDPQLELYRGSALLQRNDNWGGTSSLKALFASVGASSVSATSKDAAIDITLEPGSYTALVSGVKSTSGIARFELYLVP